MVQSGDTMISIANHFGVTLADLAAANPQVSPSFLQPGDTLQIPAASGGAAVPPLADFVEILQVQCYPAAAPYTGSTQCLALVENQGDVPVEDVAVRVLLHPTDGDTVSAQAFALLDALFPSARVPVVLLLEGVYPNAEIEAQVVSALPFDENGGRYAEGRARQIFGTASSTSLAVDGWVTPPPGDWASVWLALSGFDADGRLVAARRVAMNVDGAAAQPFQAYLFSLAGEISRIDIAVIWAADSCLLCP